MNVKLLKKGGDFLPFFNLMDEILILLWYYKINITLSLGRLG